MEHDRSYATEETLKEYANVDIALNNQQYIEGAKRILLILNMTSLFVTDVSYYTCYDSFSTSWWKKNWKVSIVVQTILMSKLQIIHQLMNCFTLLINILYTDKRYTP